ncbi:MAG: hypothetical protein E3J25_02930 [Anaerolineales bacterium]|nr:MAG: hypothetical protein E3J25_02930 [Anaerolineales bacterium]
MLEPQEARSRRSFGYLFGKDAQNHGQESAHPTPRVSGRGWHALHSFAAKSFEIKEIGPAVHRVIAKN